MSDAKVYIDAGNELHGAVVETDSYIVNISRQYARIFSYDDYLSGVVTENFWAWEDETEILWEDGTNILTEE
jgi:hypothetical protein